MPGGPRQFSAFYRQHVEPFYPGGLSREIDASIESARKFPVDFGEYGTPNFSLIDDPVPVHVQRLRPSADASYENNQILLSEALDPQYASVAALPHELTHHIYRGPGQSAGLELGKSPDALWKADSRRPFYRGSDSPKSPYLNRPVELDAHLADVKRRYTLMTGNEVRTPRDAANAWRWWVTGGNEMSASAGLPSTIGRHTPYYDSMPDAAKQIMFRRMPGVAPAVLAPLLLPALQEGE